MFAGRENRTSRASGPHSTAILLPVPRTTLGQKQSHFREGNRDSGTEESPVHECDHVSLHTKIPRHQDEERCAKVQHGVCVCPRGPSGDLRHCWVTGKVIVRQGEANNKVVTSSGQGWLPLKADQETEGLGWGRQSSPRRRMTLMLRCEVVVMGTLKIREDVFREGGRK